MHYAVSQIGWGWMAAAAAGEKVAAIILPQSSPLEAEGRLLDFIKGPCERVWTPLLKTLFAELEKYFEGETMHLDFTPDFAGATQFSQRVWEATRKIPYGQTRSYGWVAKEAGSPKAARAVGQALSRNPLPLLVPCHRVVAANGIGGFTGGLSVKRQLLSLEGANF